MTWNGADPVKLADGTLRGFPADGDTVMISGTAPGRSGAPIGLGEVAGTVVGQAPGPQIAVRRLR